MPLDDGWTSTGEDPARTASQLPCALSVRDEKAKRPVKRAPLNKDGERSITYSVEVAYSALSTWQGYSFVGLDPGGLDPGDMTWFGRV